MGAKFTKALMRLNLMKCVVLAACLAMAPTAPLLAQDSATSTPSMFDRIVKDDGNWYFSWGYSRQQYGPSDIHVTQPELGNNFTVHNVAAKDYPSTIKGAIVSLLTLNVTSPQENVRIGKFMNEAKDFALEFSLDHSKYNTNFGQTVKITGMKNNQPIDSTMVLTPTDFKYNLHNGLNHVMMNGAWFHHLAGPQKQPGDLQLVSRAGAGILLPHADNMIFGNQNQVGPKTKNICCTSSNDWWQLNGWTVGAEVGMRYTFYKSVYVELTAKRAYGVLRNVPVYKGNADQKIWMNEQVLTAGFLF